MKRSSSQSGFTLIEMIVSLALFSVVVTISVGALLVLIASNQRFQNEQTVMTNLSFALDSMTREIRTGTNYYCDAQNSKNAGPNGRKIFRDGDDLDSAPVQDCYNGNSASRVYQGMSFVESGQSITGAADTKIVYFYDSDEQSLFRRVSGESAQSIVSSGIVITDAEFFVTSSAELDSASGDTRQPMVTIYLEAKDSNDATEKVYQIQTTVTQRTLDL